MPLFDFIKKNFQPREATQQASMLNGFSPIFSQFGEDVFASDVVQQAIHCIVTEMVKLTPRHFRGDELNEMIVSDSRIQRFLNEPNDRMIQSDFIEKVFWQLFLNFNAFIIPTYELKREKDGSKTKVYTGLYPVAPTQVDFLQDPSGQLFIKLRFANNYETTLLYSDVIHIRHYYSVNEFMGGNEMGQPDNKALIKVLELNNVLLQGVGKALKSSFAINGIIKYPTLIDKGAMAENIARIQEHLQNNESGFLPMDIKGEFIPLQNKIQLVDEKTLKFIDEKILRHFGVPLAILTGDYTKAQYEAFYQKTLEPLIKRTGEAFTKSLFSEREKGHGNKIRFCPHDLLFMSDTSKLELVRLLGDSGAMCENEKRRIFGFPPIADLEGVRMQSLNYVNVNYAHKYQLAKKDTEGDDKNV